MSCAARAHLQYGTVPDPGPDTLSNSAADTSADAGQGRVRRDGMGAVGSVRAEVRGAHPTGGLGFLPVLLSWEPSPQLSSPAAIRDRGQGTRDSLCAYQGAVPCRWRLTVVSVPAIGGYGF